MSRFSSAEIVPAEPVVPPPVDESTTSRISISSTGRQEESADDAQAASPSHNDEMLTAKVRLHRKLIEEINPEWQDLYWELV